MPEPILNLDFSHDYQVEILAARPQGKPVNRIPESGEDVDALYVRFEAAGGESWIGAFARGFASDELVSGAFAWPDGKSVCVVSAGYGYVVKANDPKSVIRLQPMPITDVRVLPEHNLIVLTDFTHMYAFNAEKTAWRTERLSWDGVTVTSVATNYIFGIGWDQTIDKEVEFVVDVRNGQHTGGAQPWARR
jgi:hypothetical protein